MGRFGIVIRRVWGNGMRWSIEKGKVEWNVARWRIEKMKWMIYIYMHGYENVIVLVSGSFWKSNPDQNKKPESFDGGFRLSLFL